MPRLEWLRDGLVDMHVKAPCAVLFVVLTFCGCLTGRFTSMAIDGDIAVDVSISSFMIEAHRVVRQHDAHVAASTHCASLHLNWVRTFLSQL